MLNSLPAGIRLIGGALLGAAAWAALGLALPFVPESVRFVLAWFVFTFGPGIAMTGYLTRDLDRVRRVVVALGAGTAATPVLIDCLGRVHAVPAFPYIAAAMAGGSVLLWRRQPEDRMVRMSSGDMAACAVLVALAVGLGGIVFGHRLESTPNGIIVNGEYDSADLSYYAAEASEASHTVPPMASYYSGHHLNAAYYPQLVLAMIHRFAGVPILPIYFRYAWPTFLSLSALVGFLLVRSIAPRAVAVLAIALVLAGSDLSYLWAWSLDQDPPAWDYVLWPTNFLSPTMHLLQFNTWGPSMPVFFTALYAIVRGLQTGSRAWIVVSAVLLAVLFEFKPFAYVILMAALAAAAVFSGSDWRARWRFAATVALTVVFTLPFLVGAALLDPGDRRTRLVFQPFALPKRMLIKLDLTDAFTNAANYLSPWPPMRTPVFVLLATIVFLAIGVGVRWLGAPGVWRAIRHGGGENAAAWRLLGWGVVAGIAVPFVLATEPYVDTLQFYVTGLYLLWIFAAAALVACARAHPRRGLVAIAVAIAVSLPSSVHYLSRRWADRQRPPRITLGGSEIQIAEYLRATSDPETTVVLHDRPLSPSLTTIVSERRIVLGWDVRYSAVGGEERLRDVNAFFASSHDSPDAAFDILGRYHVTHVIVREQDRVHPAVVARLKPLKQFPDVTLYAVP
jgi:hypothetical protein